VQKRRGHNQVEHTQAARARDAITLAQRDE